MIEGLPARETQALLDECEEKLTEAQMSLVKIGDRLLDLPVDLVNCVCRSFHRVSGAAGYLGHVPLKTLSQSMESVMVAVRERRLKLNGNDINALLLVADRMRKRVQPGCTDVSEPFSAELQKLERILDRAANAAPVAAGSTLQRQLKMLVVEDELCSRTLLQGLLSEYGLCHTAINGREAVEAFVGARQSGSRYDLICMDINMPELDGCKAVEAIRAIEVAEDGYNSGVRIFMTTSSYDTRTIVAFEELCDSYLFKPVDADRLEENMRTYGLIPKLVGESSTPVFSKV